MSASKSFLVSATRLASHRLRLPAASPPAYLGHRASSTSTSEPHASNLFMSEEANAEECVPLFDDQEKPPPPHLFPSTSLHGHPRSAEDNSRHKPDSCFPLPPPPKPSGYPAPMLNNDDIKTYLAPLYHRGWSYHFHTLEDMRLSPVLRKLYRFPDDRAALTFVANLSQHASNVQHHPVIRFCNKDVFVFLFTHSAYLPAESDLAVRSAAIGERVEKPGVTYHDLGLAYHAEVLHETMRTQTGFPPHTLLRPFAERPRTVRELLTQFRAIVEKRTLRRDAEREAHRNAQERRRQRANEPREPHGRYVKPGDERSSRMSGASDGLTLLRTLQKIRNQSL